MKTFQDSAGRTWTISMTVDSVKRVRDLMKINLIEPESGDPPLLTRLGMDDLLMLDVIYCLIQPQAEQLNISDTDFAKALGGDAVLSAINAFYEEMVDFFLKRGRTDRAKAVGTQHRMIALAIQRIDGHISRIDPEKVLDETVGS
ncbi:MAG: hypothetical protein A2Y07_06875 [Planctomycetes bacterium GWF2_50_10]|nr:MAG: hypothetical protein A2Y07_06875 [Planctomycetes bacterium GWF2_50_10]